MAPLLFDWPYAGLGVSIALLVWLALEKKAWRTPEWVLALLWPMYLIHQFEEHGIDLLGRHYAFLGDLCKTLGYAPGTCPADAAFIFAVNVVACQIAFAIAWLTRRRYPLVAACAWGIPIVNAVAHIGGALLHRSYNPGLFTAIVLFVPLSIWMLTTLLRSQTIRAGDVPRIVAAGVVTHIVLIASLLLRPRGWIGHEELLAINGANGLWPLVFGMRLQRPSEARVSR